MPDIVLFGATGYTGKLTAHALTRRGASFAIAGRNRTKLDALAAETGAEDVRVARVGDTDGLVDALRDARVLITCVGPFQKFGETAIEAALRAHVHYVDSTGEGSFIDRLIRSADERAKDAGIAIAPAMGFDEVPADVAATLATEGMTGAELVLTYAFATSASAGTIRTTIDIVRESAPFLVDGKVVPTKIGAETRWAPMPPPLGPRKSASLPVAEAHLAPLHLDLRTLKTFATVGRAQAAAMSVGIPLLGALASFGPTRKVLDAAINRLPEGPDERQRAAAKWTILAEAKSAGTFRNVTIVGHDHYGVTAETLAAGAMAMCEPGYDKSGVMAPVQAAGLDVLQKTLADFGVETQTYQPTA